MNVHAQLNELVGPLAGRIEMVRRRATLADVAARAADIHGGRIMATEAESGRALTYVGAAELVARWSDVVADRTERGDVVVIANHNGLDQFLLCLAVSRAGRIPAPVNDQMRPAEIDHVLSDSGATLIVRDVAELDGCPAAVEPATPQPEDVAAIFYTSGTTGKPKGAALTHRSLLAAAPAAMIPSSIRHDEVISALPVAHIMGFTVYLSLAMAGVASYVFERFDAEAVMDAIETRRPSVFIGVPSMYRRMEEAGAVRRDLRSVRVWGSGADAMPAGLVDRFKQYGGSAKLPLIGEFGEAAFIEGYGMVEVGGGCALNISPPYVPSSVSAGVATPIPGYRIRIIGADGSPVNIGGVGELWVKGPGVLKEYWRDPAATAAIMAGDGWLRTGDLVRRGPARTFIFQSRTKLVIKSGGYSVYPAEVEAVLEEHPEVVQAAVAGLISTTMGEIPVAAVRLNEGSKLTAKQLLSWADERLSHYKTPREIAIVDSLPMGATGKLLRDDILPLFEHV
jgi:acyl-CoA synthetase (AMP-forming)/AMP-acid ligase II